MHEKKIFYAKKDTCPRFLPLYFLLLGFHVDSQYMLGEGEIFGTSVINAETSRPLAKLEEGASTFSYFPPSPYSFSVLCFSSFSLPHSRSYPDSFFAWISSQWLHTRLLAASDFGVTLPMAFIFLQMNFWNWGAIAKSGACQSGAE